MDEFLAVEEGGGPGNCPGSSSFDISASGGPPTYGVLTAFQAGVAAGAHSIDVKVGRREVRLTFHGASLSVPKVLAALESNSSGNEPEQLLAGALKATTFDGTTALVWDAKTGEVGKVVGQDQVELSRELGAVTNEPEAGVSLVRLDSGGFWRQLRETIWRNSNQHLAVASECGFAPCQSFLDSARIRPPRGRPQAERVYLESQPSLWAEISPDALLDHRQGVCTVRPISNSSGERFYSTTQVVGPIADPGQAAVGPTTYACGAYFWLAPPGKRVSPETEIHWVRHGVVIAKEKLDFGLPGSSIASGTTGLSDTPAGHELPEDEPRQARRDFLRHQLGQMLVSFHHDLGHHCGSEPAAASLLGWLESQALFKALS
ncbi:MAG: hypothetical protein KC910_11060 [Candidatus Eremiobacteraeota bacterium]|nr:hypothetical protein [Candidatus Eremiobacteraeota bacterium]